jgi:plastocyanin
VRSRTSRLVTVSAVAALGVGVFAAGAFGATAKLSLTSPSGCCKFNTKNLSAKAGTVSVTLTNRDAVPHNVAIKQVKKVIKKGPVVGTGKKSIVTATLKKGSYTFYCSVPGHEAAGMKGALKIT